jgi:hypothetical protein
MPYSSLSGPVGHQQVALFGLPDTTQRVQYGLVGDFMDPYWGGCQAIYVKANGTIRMGGLCVVTPAVSGGQVQYLATEVPNTANLARSAYVAMTPMTTGQFGWLACSGVVPVNSSAAVAADTSFGIAAAGQAGAVAAGKQVLGGRVVIASSATVAKQGVAANGSNRLQITGDAGWFIGAFLSGTGIAAGTTITDIDPSGTQVTLSANTTAQVNGTVTATYNNGTIFYNVAHINDAMYQGAIT